MTLVATLLPSISSDFNKSNEASWLGTSYLLAACTFTPLYGRLCNVMGRRGANQLAVVIAATGTLACGFSTNMKMLIAARFLTGMGGGGIFTTSTIVTSDMYSMRSRGLTQGVSSLFNGLGMGLGGPIGGLVSDWLGWRWAFLIQMPLFFVSLFLTTYNLHYVTPGKGKSAKEVLKRIDYGGSLTLLVAIGSFLVFLSMKYNEDMSWGEPWVIVPLVLAGIFIIIFILVEILVAPEPVLAPALLRQKVPVLVGISNFLVALCNFSVMYFFPMWFQTVALTSASIAGLHLLPNSTSMSIGSLFAGWMMHRTGKYKMINLIFGAFPFIGIVLITQMREDSGPLQMWLSIIPLGFGNAVVLQTMLIALLAHLPESSMAVGTGFGQVFRGIGQVGGVAISSALFQSKLDSELRRRIHAPNAEEIISEIRHSAKLVANLPPDLQRAARDSYAVSLKAVFILAACSTFLAYLARLPIPDKTLEHKPRKQSNGTSTTPGDVESHSVTSGTPDEGIDSDDGDMPDGPSITRPKPRRRRLSTFESTDGILDLESETVGGSARQRPASLRA
ncbi:major facilitator superfamily domain-containing protein [Hygrophoropsis aurantiaca]|uniref:Major facilitator superfamily domain-containing protein n=1 Tax=Hygrophoropsis aurantiaca TaxID=72124 RepID=A0ACB8ACS4_9AGAM|nr:major facilitator superfamily domain-containing protein [Hygrophoropsis aurantiaca]